ncbi:hypothetical protein J416_04723 [Gracilibacillus halophilus YIM-C55.5]|uniref:YozE SAM-like domain-containing protein n=1 Tax=Gracilibacillus halophilus YIM-C55.5 TaxID=1308866 RepID=N4WAF4_9BACI|nr:sterile alpha motif-like domain-containing protein [Gracilibacillus halophilus]ENH97293.1 hypothetical protein J416_04723 [Gracilibacillus halophilus YIM-C55.5]
MKSFYHFMMRYRGSGTNHTNQLANWMFHEHDFPKQATDYHTISQYLEWHSPFTKAIATFDRLWDEYQEEENHE